MKDVNNYFYQTDPCLNQYEAWSSSEYPQANYHFFRDSGCVVTSIWNMCSLYKVDGIPSPFPTPWELNEACKAKGVFYPNANIEMALLCHVLPIAYLDRFSYEESLLRKQFADHTMCLLRVNGQNSPFHYILPLPTQTEELLCFDPKTGYQHLSGYKAIYQIIRFLRTDNNDKL